MKPSDRQRTASPRQKKKRLALNLSMPCTRLRSFPFKRQHSVCTCACFTVGFVEEHHWLGLCLL